MHNPPPIVTRDSHAARPSSGWLGVPVVLVLLVGGWIAASQSGDPLFVPRPSAVLAALDRLTHDPAVVGVATATLLGAGAGFLVALVVGAVLSAVLAGQMRQGALALAGVPAAAVAPLAMIWLGTGGGSEIGVTIVGAAAFAFAPIIVGFAADGVARRAGVDVGAVMALNGALVAEFVGGNRGLGHLLMRSIMVLEIADTVAIALVLAAIGIVAVLAVHAMFALAMAHERDA